MSDKTTKRLLLVVLLMNLIIQIVTLMIQLQRLGIINL